MEAVDLSVIGQAQPGTYTQFKKLGTSRAGGCPFSPWDAGYYRCSRCGVCCCLRPPPHHLWNRTSLPSTMGVPLLPNVWRHLRISTNRVTTRSSSGSRTVAVFPSAARSRGKCSARMVSRIRRRNPRASRRGRAIRLKLPRRHAPNLDGGSRRPCGPVLRSEHTPSTQSSNL